MNALVIGGNKFFGRRLVQKLVDNGHNVTLMSRGNVDDGFGDKVSRIKCDRTDLAALHSATKGTTWDIVYDQVCFSYTQAKQTCEVFNSKTPRYIFTSSQSVYSPGDSLVESDFDPKSFSFEPNSDFGYAEGKRRAEVGFETSAEFAVAYMRFPIVIDTDDTTQRIQFHVNRVQQGKDIYFPNPDAKISFITADFAAETLYEIGMSTATGPINAASPSPVSLSEFVSLLEQGLNKKVILAKAPSPDNESPYGISESWYMSCEKLAGLGLKAQEIKDWLPPMVEKI